MKGVIFSELLKLRKRSTLVFLPTAMAATSLALAFASCVSLYFHFSGQTHLTAIKNLSGKNLLGSGIGMINFFLSISLFALTASSMASEYSLGTIKNCYINQPNRKNFLAGKFLALTIYTTALFALCSFISLGATAIFAFGGGVRMGVIFGFHSVLTAILACLSSYLAIIAYIVLGLVCGTVLSSPTLAISLPLIWLIVIEPIISGAVKSISPYLFGNAVGRIVTPHSLGSFSEALLIVLIYLIPLIFFTMHRSIHRDILNHIS